MHLVVKLLQILHFVPNATLCLDSQAHASVFSHLQKGASSCVGRQDSFLDGRNELRAPNQVSDVKRWIAHLILCAEICPFVVELLQCPQVLANDSCMQVCSKLPCPLQNILSIISNHREHETVHLLLLIGLCGAYVMCIYTCQHSWDTHMNHEPTVLMSTA